MENHFKVTRVTIVRSELEPEGGTVFHCGTTLAANSCVDFQRRASNNPPMPRPDAGRRVKSYSAADGYVYQHYFFEGNRAQRAASPGVDFTYEATADRRPR